MPKFTDYEDDEAQANDNNFNFYKKRDNNIMDYVDVGFWVLSTRKLCLQ